MNDVEMAELQAAVPLIVLTEFSGQTDTPSLVQCLEAITCRSYANNGLGFQVTYAGIFANVIA